MSIEETDFSVGWEQEMIYVEVVMRTLPQKTQSKCKRVSFYNNHGEGRQSKYAFIKSKNRLHLRKTHLKF